MVGALTTTPARLPKGCSIDVHSSSYKPQQTELDFENENRSLKVQTMQGSESRCSCCAGTLKLTLQGGVTHATKYEKGEEGECNPLMPSSSGLWFITETKDPVGHCQGR